MYVVEELEGPTVDKVVKLFKKGSKLHKNKKINDQSLLDIVR